MGVFGGHAPSLLADLLWRYDCVCCGRVEQEWVKRGLCRDCGAQFRRKPQAIYPTQPLAIPLYSMGDYGGVYQNLILAAKEKYRSEALGIMGSLYAAGVRHLRDIGLIEDQTVVFIPAPSRPQSLRKRGGNIVEKALHKAIAELVGETHSVRERGKELYMTVRTPLALAKKAQDSVGLSVGERYKNFSSHIYGLRPEEMGEYGHGQATVIFVDDVCTTGTTIDQSQQLLASYGVMVRAGLVLASA